MKDCRLLNNLISLPGAQHVSLRLLRPQVLHERRTQLVERETALQRWVVALEMEAARQAAAAKQLKQQEEKVGGG